MADDPRTVTMQLTPEEARIIKHMRTDYTPDAVSIHLIAQRSDVGVAASTVDVYMTITDAHVFGDVDARVAFEREVGALVAPWLDVDPRRVFAAEVIEAMGAQADA